jgi:hypothetical protein
VGNLNAYKHGKTSRQHARLAEIIVADPEALALAREILSGESQRQARRIEQAKRLLDTLFAKAQERAADRAAQDYERRRLRTTHRTLIKKEFAEHNVLFLETILTL